MDVVTISAAEYSAELMKGKQNKVNLYLNYTKGSEDKIVLKYYFYEQDIDGWFSLSTVDPVTKVLSEVEVFLTVTKKQLYPVELPTNCEKIKIALVYSGSMTAPGTLIIDGIVNSPYKS